MRIPIRSTDAPADQAQLIRDLGADARRQIAESLKDVADFGLRRSLTPALEELARTAKAPMGEAFKAMAEQSQLQLKQLRQIQADAFTMPTVAMLAPSPEVRASRAIAEQTARLVEISDRTSIQIGQLAQLAEQALNQQIQQAVIASGMAADARRTGNIIIWLTVAIAVLTAVLVMNGLRIWPFVGV